MNATDGLADWLGCKMKKCSCLLLHWVSDELSECVKQQWHQWWYCSTDVAPAQPCGLSLALLRGTERYWAPVEHVMLKSPMQSRLKTGVFNWGTKKTEIGLKMGIHESEAVRYLFGKSKVLRLVLYFVYADFQKLYHDVVLLNRKLSEILSVCLVLACVDALCFFLCCLLYAWQHSWCRSTEYLSSYYCMPIIIASVDLPSIYSRTAACNIDSVGPSTAGLYSCTGIRSDRRLYYWL